MNYLLTYLTSIGLTCLLCFDTIYVEACENAQQQSINSGKLPIKVKISITVIKLLLIY
jgi:hypothetical protein